MNSTLLTANEVCTLVGISIYTLNRWYKYKEMNPDSEYSQMLPEITHTINAPRSPRYWKQDDVWKLLEFKSALPKGCRGIMGSVSSHKYDKPKEDKKNGKKKISNKRTKSN